MARQLDRVAGGRLRAGPKFEDTYREQVLDLIERKAAGETEIESPRRQPSTADKVVDLMAALEASVKAAKAARERHPAGRRRRGRRAERRRRRSRAQDGVSRLASVSRPSHEHGRDRRPPLKVSNLDKVLYPEVGFTKARGHRLLRARSRRRCCPTSPTAASRCGGTPTASTRSRSSRSAARRTGPSGSRRRRPR